MRQIAHISDLHFGAEEPAVAEGLSADLSDRSPHLVAVSGDLTQRARRRQFAAARDFLARIPQPQLVVPGNHDIPLYDVFNRAMRPLARFRRYITRDMHPFFQDEQMAVAGVNTARANTWKDGRVSLSQIHRLREQFDSVSRDHFKVLVAHHPFIPPHDDPHAAMVGRAKLALKTLSASGCTLILAGHLHAAYSGDVRPHHIEIKRSILVAQAGTAVSHRRRNEPNAYNWITFDRDRLTIEVRTWNGRRFETARQSEFTSTDHGWSVKRGSPPASSF